MSELDLAAAVIARLKDQLPDLHGRVAGAVDFLDLVTRGTLPERTPAAFVVVQADAGDTPQLTTAGYSYRLTQEFTVVVIERYAGDQTGDKARALLVPWRAALRTALLGWTPPAEKYEAVGYRTGRTFPLSGSASTAVADQVGFFTRRLISVRTR